MHSILFTFDVSKSAKPIISCFFGLDSPLITLSISKSISLANIKDISSTNEVLKFVTLMISAKT